jgi:Xaa-Pro aminopeptidase
VDTRLKALEACLAHDGLDAALITSPNNRRYFSGFSGTSGMLLITPGARVLFTDSRYTLQVKAEAPDFELVQTTQQDRLSG